MKKEYVEEGYKSIDNYDGDITKSVVLKKDNDGITYTSTDSSGNTSSVKRMFNDLIKPVIKLNGKTTLYFNVGDKYDEQGYTATDNCDGDITRKVVIDNNMNLNVEGTYYIKYTVEDSSKNKTEVKRTIHVLDKKLNDTENKVKNIYLTFDDGPSMHTGRILEILKKYDIKATFFVTNQFNKYSYYIKEAYLDGHAIALHTSSHNFSKIYSSKDSFFLDLDNISKTVYEETGEYSKLLRFAGGSSNTISCYNKGVIPSIIKKLNDEGYTYFDWNVDSGDTSSKNKNTIAKNIINGIKANNSSIVLQHDLYPSSIEATIEVIEYGLSKGYKFLPLDSNSPTMHHAVSRCHL